MWSMLHNFGGNIGLYGRFDIVNNDVLDARAAPGSSMVGIGLTMEGINQNYFIYEIMAELAWRNTSVDANSWTEQFAFRRYGIKDSRHPSVTAWKLLREVVYNSNQTWTSVTKSMTNLRPGEIFVTLATGLFVAVFPCSSTIFPPSPALELLRETFMPTKLHYDATELEVAWDLLVSSIPDLGANNLFQFDLVEITQQVLSNIFLTHQLAFSEAYAQRNLPLAREIGNELLTVITELDELLASNHRFLLGSWIQSAKSWATSAEEEALFDFNARNQVTLW